VELKAYLTEAGIDVVLPRNAAEIFEATELRDLSEPLSAVRPALRVVEFEPLLELVILRHRWLDALNRLNTVNAALQAEGLAPLKSFQVGVAPRRDRVTALGQIQRVSPPDELDQTIALYEAALEHALKASVIATTLVAGHARAAQLPEYDGTKHAAAELTPEAWFLLQRAVKDGAVKTAWEHPAEAIFEAAGPAIPTIAAQLGKKKPAAYLKERLPFFDSVLDDRLSSIHGEALLRTIAGEYRALLEAPPVKVQPLGAVYIGTDKQRVGLALLDKRGAIAATAPLRPSGDWPDRILRWLRDQKSRLVVIPQTAAAGEWLTELETFLESQKARVVKVSPAGMVEARAIDDPALRRVSPEEASAIVLVRRAAKPIDEWCRIEPSRLGLSRVQGELDAGQVNEALQVVRERVIAAAQPLSAAPVVTGGLRARPTAPLNPEITSIRDLRPGLQLKGVITNVTKFGAFVNLGLKQEGLVHISELADEFVAEPAEVVQSGQQVNARVISVDVDRGRIALSLRSEAAAMRGPARGPGRPMRDPMAGGPPRRTSMGSAQARPTGSGAPRLDAPNPSDPDRRRALQDLENLFKKPGS
jgi:predicted RNA-binding protein with RPS1 domain